MNHRLNFSCIIFHKLLIYSAESGCLLLLKLRVNDCFPFMKEFCSELKAYYIHKWFKGLLKQAALSLKGCEELKTEIIPNFRFWAFFLCPTSEFSSCICVATCACSLFWLLLWGFFNLLSSFFYPMPGTSSSLLPIVSKSSLLWLQPVQRLASFVPAQCWCDLWAHKRRYQWDVCSLCCWRCCSCFGFSFSLTD